MQEENIRFEGVLFKEFIACILVVLLIFPALIANLVYYISLVISTILNKSLEALINYLDKQNTEEEKINEEE